jgi:hypothetical protein
MRRLLTIVIVVIAAASIALPASAQNKPQFNDRKANVTAAGRGAALTPASQASPVSVTSTFLRGRGKSDATIQTLRAVGQFRAARNGITHLRLEQEVSGLKVYGTYVKASLNSRGELVHIAENIAPAPRGPVARASINERAALVAAMRQLHPGVQVDFREGGRSGNTVTFSGGAFFYRDPTVTRVAMPMTDGSMAVGFQVETWTKKRNLLHETLVGGDGRVLLAELRTNDDSYNVFRINPDKTPQAIVNGPGAGNGQSPAGWLFNGAQRNINIAGNNVHAYLDTDANNKPDAGGETVSDGNFLTSANLDVAPSDAVNRAVAVQNLFYLNNIIHDTLYRSGFNEAAGNFQENNFGRGGKTGDSVDAEAQDGGGLNNANFATPPDGVSPRMQMFLWNGLGTHQVVVHAPAGVAGTYLAQGAAFGPPLDATGITADVVVANDGAGASPTDACEALTTPATGQIVLADRGTCNFTVKVKNAQNAGAVGAIIANNTSDFIFTMGGSDPSITIPSVFIGRTDGATLKAATGVNATIRLSEPPPLMIDGDLDSDVVWHEYGHGLTWRMIGHMRGPLAGAIGEGMSDVLSVLINEDDVVGEYATSNPAGIRTAPYTDYPRTYGDIAGSEVHFDGEVYAAIGWQMFLNYTAAGIAKDELLATLVDGMNFTPPGPTYEQMRDGILQSVLLSDHRERECLIWSAFAKYGVGVGAVGKPLGSKAVTSESFVLPDQCSD